MARRQTSRESKKLKDKWKAKQWYSIIAPDMFNRAKIGETLADEPEKLIGRTVEVTLQDLTGDFRMMHVKLKFRIIDHSTSEAYTRFLGHDLTSDFIRRQTRRKRTKMEGVFEVETKDGYVVRLKPMAISDKRIQSSAQFQIRKKMGELIDGAGKSHTLSELTSVILTSDRDKSLVSKLLTGCRKIYPLKRVDIRRMEVIKFPEAMEKEESISSASVPEDNKQDEGGPVDSEIGEEMTEGVEDLEKPNDDGAPTKKTSDADG